MSSESEQTRPELGADDASSQTRVLVLAHTGARSYVVPHGATFTIGRHSECEIVVDVPSVSRRHARVTGGDRPLIEDLGGMNGVRLGGRRIPVGEPVPIQGGDVVELGGAILVIQPPREAGAARLEPHPTTSSDDPMHAVEQLVDLVAQSELSVLLLGETGVGKTVTAEAIHARSLRARGPLLRLNCAAMPEALLEGELFGYERGAFTGAMQAKAGLLESASGGTVLMDEIGEMPLATQAKLLTVVESREVLPLGALRPRPIDVRFIAATHRDLLARAREGTFRLDLYYRLNGISILIPPLRERPREIPAFAARFLERACANLGRRAPPITREALGFLMRQPYFGNLRELRNTMERAAVLSRGLEIRPEHLLFESHSPTAPATLQTLPPSATTSSHPPPAPVIIPKIPAPPPPPSGPLRDQVNAFERDRILRALEECNGNQTRAAALLGMSRRALITRIEQYGLPRPRKR